MRTLSKQRIKQLPEEVRQARQHLKQNGYTYQSAADALERNRSHLAEVMSGDRQSKSLCLRILDLPTLNQ